MNIHLNIKTLEKNIKNIHGQKGIDWLNALPTIQQKLSKFWSLTNIMPVNNMSYNYVALALQNNNPVVLKISCDKQLIQDEYKALKHFNGQGSIRALDIHSELNALLLEQAVPGYLLKEHHPEKIADTIHIYSNVVKALANQPLSDNNYTHVSQWCKAIDRITDSKIEKHFSDKAKKLKSELLSTTQPEYLCHGDLHLENIIKQKENWFAIDPKGIVGEMAFEAAAFDLVSKHELQDESNVPSLMLDRITKLSTALDINFDRLLSWIFLRILISAQWFIEDNGDPSQMLVLAKYIYPLI